MVPNREVAEEGRNHWFLDIILVEPTGFPVILITECGEREESRKCPRLWGWDTRRRKFPSTEMGKTAGRTEFGAGGGHKGIGSLVLD